MAAPRKYPVELQQRAIRLWRSEQPRRPISHLARELGVHPEALRNWIRQDQADRGERDDQLTTAQLEELRRLREENAELRRTNEILRRRALMPGRGLADDCLWAQVPLGMVEQEVSCRMPAHATPAWLRSTMTVAAPVLPGQRPRVGQAGRLT